MAHVHVAGQQHGLHRGGQVEQAQQVAGGRTRAADGLRGLFVREAEFVQQAAHALRLFERVQVFALDVFDQRHDGRVLVGHFAHQHRHFLQAGDLGGAKTALARDDFVLAGRGLAQRAHKYGLHDALCADRFGQFAQGALVHARARLVFAGAHLGDGQGGRRTLGLGRGLADVLDGGRVRAEQGVQSAAQSLGFLGGHS